MTLGLGLPCHRKSRPNIIKVFLFLFLQKKKILIFTHALVLPSRKPNSFFGGAEQGAGFGAGFLVFGFGH